MPLILPESMHDEWLAADRPGDQELVVRAVASSEALCRTIVGAEPEPGAERLDRVPALFEL